jgi:tetratricopeptide (TPR) repeat protein
MSASQTKLFLAVGAVVLFVLLFIAPKTRDKEAQVAEASKAVASTANLAVYVSTAEKNLADDLAKKYKALTVQDSIIEFWTRGRRPDLAAHFAEKKAKESNKALLWFEAGNRYYYAVQFTQDQSEVPVLVQSAIRSFSKGLELEPNNTDAKIMLASAIVESGSDPMKGISLLREIEKVDSNNVKLQLSFAFLSLRSGQLDKAIMRFQKVLVLDPTYLEAYINIADAYSQMGNKEGTIEMLEKFASKTEDATAKQEVEDYIRQLKETN